MTTHIASDVNPHHPETEDSPTLDREPAQAPPKGAPSFDPTSGRQIGSDPYDDPTQGRRIGSDPDDDPTRTH